jgi:hypothetical protein
MYIGIILAEDGNIDASISFDTREEAEEQMAKIKAKYFNEYDRVLIEAPQSLESFIKEWDELQKENEYYEAAYKMSANAVDGLDDGMDRFHE